METENTWNICKENEQKLQKNGIFLGPWGI